MLDVILGELILVRIKTKSFKYIIARELAECQSTLNLTLHEHFNDAVAIKQPTMQIVRRAKQKNVSQLAFC